MADDPNHDGYRLTRDSVSSVRLAAQHYLWREAVGFNLDPRIIPPNASKSFRVADVGTGTGIWVSELKTKYDFSIDGLDMSLAQCPPRELWPRDCSFRKLNILEHVPEEFRGVYDVVHARLIQGGLKDSPMPALKNLIAMLKPGGYLQWQEINLSSLKVTLARPDLKHEVMDELAENVRNFHFGRWTPRLAEFCTEAGLLDARQDRYQVPPEIGIPFVQTQFGAYAEVSRVAMDNSTPESKGPQFRKLLERAHEELNSGVHLGHWLDVTVARKPA